MEIRMEKTKVMRASRQLSRVQICYIKNNYLGNMITKGASCKHAIKSRIAMETAVLIRRKLFLPANWS